MGVWMRAIIVLCIIFVVILSGCIMPDYIMPGCIQGSGNYATENRVVDDFRGIELSGEGNVYLSQGQKLLRIEAEDNIIREIETSVSADRLRIRNRADCINPSEPISIYVSTPEIENLRISGSGRIIGQSPIESDALNIDISGSGDAYLELTSQDLSTTISGSGNALLMGVAEDSNVIISGSGAVHSYDLETVRSTVTISGSGVAEVNAADELNVLISGSGIVSYRGSPAKINKEVRGPGIVVDQD